MKNKISITENTDFACDSDTCLICDTKECENCPLYKDFETKTSEYDIELNSIQKRSPTSYSWWKNHL